MTTKTTKRTTGKTAPKRVRKTAAKRATKTTAKRARKTTAKTAATPVTPPVTKTAPVRNRPPVRAIGDTYAKRPTPKTVATNHANRCAGMYLWSAAYTTLGDVCRDDERLAGGWFGASDARRVLCDVLTTAGRTDECGRVKPGHVRAWVRWLAADGVIRERRDGDGRGAPYRFARWGVRPTADVIRVGTVDATDVTS